MVSTRGWSSREVLVLDVFISGGDEIAKYRDTALVVIRHLEQMFQKDLNQPFAIGHWDFRLDPPRIVPAGGLPARSLAMVERTNCLVAVFGEQLPPVTCKEIRHAFELRSQGQPLAVKVFVDPRLKSRSHTAFFRSIKRKFHEEVVYTYYDSEMDFQAKLFTTLTPIILGRLTPLAIVGGV